MRRLAQDSIWEAGEIISIYVPCFVNDLHDVRDLAEKNQAAVKTVRTQTDKAANVRDD